jgi:DNA polymerase-3 subunit chi
MESKAVFYILKSTDVKAQSLCACRLVDKAYKNGRKVYVYNESAEAAEKFNIHLWTFNDISFVPHEIAKPETSAPVIIGWEAPPSGFDVLVNLTLQVPHFFAMFNHVIEIIPDIAEIKTKGRERYKYYQSQNFKLETHEV